MKDWANPNDLFEKILNEKNLGGKQNFMSSPSDEIKIQLRADEKVSPAMFLPDALIPGGFKAHPLTIQAVRPDIFFTGQDEFEVLEIAYTCHKCNEKMDLQFWKRCPYCGAEISK